MRDNPGWCRPAPTSVGRCGCMHSTLCYLSTCTCHRGRSAYITAQWSSPAEIGLLGLVGASGDFMIRPTGNWERRGKKVKSTATSDDAYLQAIALKYGARVYKGVRRQVDVAGEIALLRALLHSAVQDREVAQREAEQLRRELDRVRRAAEAGASSSRAVEGSQSDLEDRLAAAVRRAEEARAELAERETELRTATDRATQLQGQVDTVTGERDQLHIWAEAAESRVAEATRELATLRVQGSSVDKEELARLRADLHAQ
ncbi:hypothetical protein Taro_053075 [Colocasia esculenta]|uniref:Uncharacterized protein n=1 Tax=Colocasia esculenta TaxID=4460 RepID=A0A843XLI1_COLES|nr:hypothetical protein [Colocasia esculenta]